MRGSRAISLAAALFVLVALLQPAAAAPAAVDGPTFTVNDAGNGKDNNVGDGYCAAGLLKCTLRAAIEEANSNPDTNRIFFNLAGTGLHTIPVTATALPEIINPVEINATTQPGCAAPCIVLDGAGLAGSPAGLYLHTNNSLIKGFAIVSFASVGIRISGNTNIVKGNYLGVLPGDAAAHPNGSGVYIDGINNLIGGISVDAHNLLSGNTYNGIMVGADPAIICLGNKIKGNYIGTDVTGTSALGNGVWGIRVNDFATGTIIGGTVAGAGNVISGNGTDGVMIAGDNTLMQGNYIGTGPGGMSSVGNGDAGIVIYPGSMGNIIGGSTSADTNWIAYNGQEGILLDGAGASAATIWRNKIFSNRGRGIDLGGDGVTFNDALDVDGGPNGRQNYPVVVSADSATREIIVRLESKANKRYTIELFWVPAGKCDGGRHGEGKTFLGRFTASTNATGFVRVTYTSPRAFAAGVEVTATATDPIGRTSEFSVCRTAE